MTVDTGPAPAQEIASVTDGAALQAAIRAHKLRTQVDGTAIWLFMIAAFAVFNAFEWVNHQSFRMVIGPISTRLLTFVIRDSAAGPFILLLASAFVAAVFAALGWLVRKENSWALLVGIALYSADFIVLIFVVGTADFMGLLFHAITLVVLVRGYSALNSLRAAGVQVPPTAVSASETAQEDSFGSWTQS